MYARDYRDLAGGGLLFLAGLWVGLHSVSTFDVGEINRMGPGMFPAALGFILAVLGAAIAIPAWFRGGTLPQIDWPATIFIMLGVLAFAITVAPFGMVPAIFLLTVAAVLADTKIGFIGTVILGIALALVAYLVFRLGLGIVLEPFRWPF